jgi:hypothetical protein
MTVLPLGVLALAVAIWMYADAASIKREKNLPSGPGGTSPGEWFIGGALLWIVALPLYIVRRGEAKSRQPLSAAEYDRVAAYEKTRLRPLARALELVSIAILASVVIGGAWFGFAWWRNHRDEAERERVAAQRSAVAAAQPPAPSAAEVARETRVAAVLDPAAQDNELRQWYEASAHARLVGLIEALKVYVLGKPRVVGDTPDCQRLAAAVNDAGAIKRPGNAEVEAAVVGVVDAATAIAIRCRAGQDHEQRHVDAVTVALGELERQIIAHRLETP